MSAYGPITVTIHPVETGEKTPKGFPKLAFTQIDIPLADGRRIRGGANLYIYDRQAAQAAQAGHGPVVAIPVNANAKPSRPQRQAR